MNISIYEIVIFAVIWISRMSSTTNAEGIFQLRLKSFTNNEGLDASGECCAPPHERSTNVCKNACRTAFRVCLKHYQVDVDPEPPCTFGMKETGVVGKNSFLPMSSPIFENKPIQFNFTFRWPGSFSLIVDAVHKRENSSDRRRQMYGSSDVLISRLVKSELQRPVEEDGRWTTPLPYRHRNSELQYSYRVLCSKYSYGKGCEVYCRPRNDHFGHYTCDSMGQKVCLPGWKGNEDGAYCTQAICENECTHGTCITPNVCKCSDGWTGSDCSRCVTYPGCVHGTCSKPYQCKCREGWGGHYCNQDLNYCINNDPCQNGATCSNTGVGGYSCQCMPGFIGDTCELEVDECEAHPCENDARCVDLINGYKCMCPINFYGRNCDETRIKCSDSPCRNNGVCTDGDKHYQCQCQSGWKGVNCETHDYCSGNPCQNGASCEETLSGFKCICRKGYSGSFCEAERSACITCLHGGFCLDTPGSDSKCHCENCQCVAPYAGRRCQHNTAAVSGTVSPIKPDILEPEQLNKLLHGMYTYKESHFETKSIKTEIVVVSDGKTAINTSQWIAICLGSGILVFVLAILSGCLIYHRKKISLFKMRLKKKNSSPSSLRSNDLDLPFVDQTRPNEKTLQNREMEVFSSAVGFLTRPTSDNLEENCYHGHSNIPSPVSNALVANNSEAKHYYDQLKGQNPGFHNSVGGKRAYPTMRQSHSLSATQTNWRDQDKAAEQCLPKEVQTNRYSLSRLPTYDEACEENDSLLRQNGVATTSFAV